MLTIAGGIGDLLRDRRAAGGTREMAKHGEVVARSALSAP